jgi:phosphatidylserine/phosphatidylglycerophosphate/cardiolipin synthase-like enzyme
VLVIVVLAARGSSAQDPSGALGPLRESTAPPPAATEHLVTTQADVKKGLAAPVRPLPAGVSPIFRAIYGNATAESARGTVPGGMVLTTNNTASAAVAIDPPAIYARYTSLIESAQHDVTIQVFEFDADSDATKTVFAALQALQAKRRAEAPGAPPVTVRILVDAMDLATDGNKPTVSLMESLGKKIQDAGFDPRIVNVEAAAYHHTGLGSLHGKSLVVDGVHAIVTGSNMGPEDAFVTGQHDAAFEVQGEVARSLLAEFDSAWLGGEIWLAGAKVPAPTPTRLAHSPIPPKIFAKPDKIEHTVLALPPAAAPLAILTLGKQPDEGLFGGNASYPLTQGVLAGINGAEKIVRIETPNLNDADVKAAILAAVRRGVEVHVLFSQNYENFAESLPGQGGSNADTVKELESALANEPEARARLQIRYYVNEGATAPAGANNTLNGYDTRANHVKLATFDDQVVAVGSLNMDTQSFDHSREVGLVIDSAAVTKEWLDALHDPDWARSQPAPGTFVPPVTPGVVEALESSTGR